eukprot:6185661-Pleurochrysis_carterae.AAC.2
MHNQGGWRCAGLLFESSVGSQRSFARTRARRIGQESETGRWPGAAAIKHGCDSSQPVALYLRVGEYDSNHLLTGHFLAAQSILFAHLQAAECFALWLRAGLFAYLYFVGRPFPFRECKPFKQSFQMRAFLAIGNLLSKFAQKKET